MLATMVFRTGLLDAADACDIGVPAVPLQRLHGDAATTALERAGVDVAIGAAVKSTDGRRVVLDDGTQEADAVVVAVSHDTVASLVPAGAVDTEAIAGLGMSPIVNLHVHYDRRVLHERFAAAEARSPLQWLFDRTEAGEGVQGQLVSVSLSGAAADIGEPLATLRERYLPAFDREDVFVRHYLAILTPEQKASTARWIRSKQRYDGSWATFFGGPPDLSTTVEAYVALRLAGDAERADHMRRAAEMVRDLGGVERTRVFTRMWLSLLSLWSWEEVPALPPEQILLPARAPLSIYSFGCWARQTLVALSIASALKPTVGVPFGIRELQTGVPAEAPNEPIARAFTALDRGLHRYEHKPIAPLRRRALRT